MDKIQKMRKYNTKDYTTMQSLKKLEQDKNETSKSKAKQARNEDDEQIRIDIDQIGISGQSPDNQQNPTDPQSNKFQTALTKLRSIKLTKQFSSNETDQPFFMAGSQSQSPERSTTNQYTQQKQDTQNQMEKSTFRPPYMDTDETNYNDDEYYSGGMRKPTGEFKRRVSRALQKNQVEGLAEQVKPNQNFQLSITELNIKHRSSLQKSNQQRVSFQNADRDHRQLTLEQESVIGQNNYSQKPSLEVGQLSQMNTLASKDTSPDHVKIISGRSSQVRESIPQLTKLVGSKISGNKFQLSPEEDKTIEEEQIQASLKYCQAITLYFKGDMKQIYPIHSQSPYKEQVQISISPNQNQNTQSGDHSSKRQMQDLQELNCAPALKAQGEIFRVLPASDFNFLNKIRKILKNKEELDPMDHFKYGEHLESLSEEMKVNLEVYDNCKNDIVKFGSSVMFMHENSQLFLKISSPSISDQHSHFKLELTPLMSDKTVFKLIPSNKIQSEGDGRITENDQFFIGFTYDKILNKDLCLYTDPILLERSGNKKKNGHKKIEPTYQSLIFSEDKKLPLNFKVPSTHDFERSENMFRHLNGKIIQIKHIESDLYLTHTIKRKENRILNMFFGDKNRYALNKLIEYMPEIYGNEASCNVHFEPRTSINTYWKVYASPSQNDSIQLENAVSKVRLKPMHLLVKSKGGNMNFEQIEQDGIYYKIFTEDQVQQNLLGSRRVSIVDNKIVENKFLWVEYLKFNQQDNKYEFSKFGSLNDEDQGSLFDSFKIFEVDTYRANAFEFLQYSYKSLNQFDSYQADNEESTEYENMLQVIKKLKKFIKNKLNGFIKVEDPCGIPNQEAQTMIKESFIIDVIAELIDQIWPDENYLKADFSGKYDEQLSQSISSQIDKSSFTSSSNLSDNGDIHREVKITLAEKIFELFRILVHDNLQLQEYVFFEIVPNIQKFFGAGFRNNQDFELFNYLVKNCDTYADYKEKTKYNIIFQFIKKLFKDNPSKIEINLFSILRSFCINSQGEANNYHQKLLHDLFFYNQLEGIKFKLQDKKTSRFKSTIQTSIQGDTLEDKSVKKIQKDLQLIEAQQRYSKSQSMRNMKDGYQSNNHVALARDSQISSSRDDLHPIQEIKIDFLHRHNEEEKDGRIVPYQSDVLKNKKSNNNTPFKSTNQKIYEEFQSTERKLSPIQDVRYETVEDEQDDFLIRHIHDITMNNLSEKIILSSKKDSHLLMTELYFFADLCYKMNFECKCSQFSKNTVSNILKLLSNDDSKLDSHIKAGLARILNTILRNHDNNIHQRPYYLRMYEKQEFVKPSRQDIISEKDVRTIVKLTRENFRQLSKEGMGSFTEYDSELLRLTQYIIQSNLIFEKDFHEGYNYVTDIFDDIARMHLKLDTYENQMHLSTNMSQHSGHQVKGDSTLNHEDFQKHYKKMRKMLQQSIDESVLGLHQNPFALKMLNLENLYTSYVEKLVEENKQRNITPKDQKDNQMEISRLEIVRFFTWLINLRIDNLISNVINMFHSQLEGFLEKENSDDLDQLIKNPEKYYIFQYMQRLMSDIMQMSSKSGDMRFSFLDNIIQGGGRDQASQRQDSSILDLDMMFQEFIKNQKKQENILKARSGFSSPIKNQFLTETDEVQLENNLFPSVDQITPRKGNVQFMHQTEDNLIVEEDKQQLEQTDKTNNNQEKQVQVQNNEINFITITKKTFELLSKAVIWLYNQRGQGNQGEQVNEGVQKEKASKKQFIDVLMNIFFNAQSPTLQQESIRAIFRYLNTRRELLQTLSKTILIFKQGEKSKIQKVTESLKHIKMIAQDSTNWEIPPEQQLQVQNEYSQQQTALDDLENADKTQVLRSNTRGQDSIKQHSLKQQYAQKLKEHQKNQQQLIQSLAFTKSNKSTEAKIQAIDIFIEKLEDLNNFFTLNQQSQYTFKSGISNLNFQNRKNDFESCENYLRSLPSYDLDQQLAFIQQDLQYAFLALQGHQVLLDFMKNCKDIRQECLRIIFYGTKPQDNVIFNEESQSNKRIQYSIKVLVAFKKCYEILIKFVYNNKTTKQIMLNDLDEILLFNSEYYMLSKMIYQLTLFDFELLNHVLDSNSRIQEVSSTMSYKLQNLISYIHKIIEFPKKPLIFAPSILKVYSNIIANCDNAKINDYVVDLILKEEVFFQIQSMLLGINMRRSKLSSIEQHSLIEMLLKGISQILQGQNVRMIKKKFYQIFQKSHDHETYFNHVKELFNQSCNYLKSQFNMSDKLDVKQISQSQNLSMGTQILTKGQSMTTLTKLEDQIRLIAQKFLYVEAYLTIIMNKLFFDVKGSQKEVQEKVDEMRMFIQARERDITILDNHSLNDFQKWKSYEIFENALNDCENFCNSNSIKPSFLNNLSKSAKKTILRHQSFLSQQFNSNRSNQKYNSQPNKDIVPLINQESNNSDLSNQVLDLQQDDSITNKLKPIFKKQISNILLGMKQNQQAQKKEEVFKIFKWNVIHDDSIRNDLKKEMHAFSEVLLKKFKQADENSGELDQQKYYMFFTKLVQYSNMFQDNKNMLNDTKVLVEIFSQFIDLTNEGQSYKGEGFEAKTIIQEKLHQVGAVQMVLDMMCSENNEQIDEIFPQLLYFSNRILDGAQNNIQDFFTEYLTKNEKAINLFERCYNLIQKEISQLRKQNTDQAKNGNGINLSKEKTPKAYDKQINVQKHILKFFKNLCENHNTKMQLLIGNQQHPEKNFDMVSLTVNYLHALISNINQSKRNYSNAQNCCISLAEYVQGPCFVNQTRIKEANFYQLAIQILQIKPHLIDSDKQKDTSKQASQAQAQINLAQQRRKSMRITRAVSNHNFDLSKRDVQEIKEVQKADGEFKLSNFMIQKLKLNCTIILLSLLEQRQNDDPLLLSMKRSIPLEVIKQNIMYEYFLFCKDYDKFLSRENFFRHVLTQSDYEVKEELIIEVGFNLYFLLKRWAENKKTNDSQLDDLISSMEQEHQEGYKVFDTFKNFFKLLQRIKKDAIKKYRKYMEGKQGEKIHNRQKLEQFLSNQGNLQEALLFFKNNSATIDVLVKNSIEQVHFPYMPYCTYLSEEEKVEFYNALPTDRDKEKIEVLVNTSTDLIRRMKIEYEFKKFFIEYPLIGELVYHTEQWKQFAFYIYLILNVMNLYSFSATSEHDRLYDPVFMGFSNQTTEFIYFIFGIVQIVLSILINFTVISKRAIYHHHLVFNDKKKSSTDDDSNDQNDGDLSTLPFWQRPKREVLKDVYTYSWSAFQDFQLLYYLGYLFFSFVGFLYHPFFYAYHMIDMIIRNPYLKNVLKAVYRPRYELFNTFILFLCLQYIFAMISYVFFYEDFEKGECSSLSQCFLVIIDQTFKNDGGIGTFLSRSYPEEMNKGGEISMKRFIFDNTFNVILVILVVEIISGIIIDTFGALREEHNKITESIENKCMICGKNRDQIEKEYQDILANDENQGSSNKENEEKAFDIHKKYRHNIYDYIFFLAYLKEKPELEYTGLESFVFEKYSEQNNTWFPIYKVGGDKFKLKNKSHENDSDEDSSDEDEQNSSQSQDEDSQDNEGTQHNEKESKHSNKMVMEYLKSLNQKVDVLTECISYGQDYHHEIEDNFLNVGLKPQVSNPQHNHKRDTSTGRGGTIHQQQSKFRTQQATNINIPNTLGVNQSPKLGVNTLSVNMNNPRGSLNRQNSSRFQKQKTKSNTLNILSGR